MFNNTNVLKNRIQSIWPMSIECSFPFISFTLLSCFVCLIFILLHSEDVFKVQYFFKRILVLLYLI